MVPAVSPNDDPGYEVHRLRAQEYVANTCTCIVSCSVKDTPGLQTRSVRPSLAAQDIRWLNLHDRESGDLYGVLPLVNGMPVALLEHIDMVDGRQFATLSTWHLRVHHAMCNVCATNAFNPLAPNTQCWRVFAEVGIA